MYFVHQSISYHQFKIGNKVIDFFFQICLVASVCAAPAEKVKRDILPGDSRYDAHHQHDHHHHHEDHKHHEAGISEALSKSSNAGVAQGLPVTNARVHAHHEKASRTVLHPSAARVVGQQVSTKLLYLINDQFDSKIRSLERVKYI